MIDWMPNPIALSLGPLQVHWYGIAYVAAIAGGTWLVMGLARQRGQDESLVINAIILLAIAALMGAGPTTSSISGPTTPAARRRSRRSSCPRTPVWASTAVSRRDSWR